MCVCVNIWTYMAKLYYAHIASGVNTSRKTSETGLNSSVCMCALATVYNIHVYVFTLSTYRNIYAHQG